MRTKTSAAILFSGICLVFFSLAAPVGISGEMPGEQVKKGHYTLRRAAVPESFVTGIALSELARVHFGEMGRVDEGLLGRQGRYITLFRKKDRKQMRITAAVYGGTAEAEDAVLELLVETSAVLQPGSRSGGTIGTQSWYLTSPKGSGTVVFIHHNSVIQVFSSDYALAEQSARAVAADLRDGANGVRLGKKVPLPRVTSVELPGTAKEKREISLILKGEDPDRRQLSFFVFSQKGQIFDGKNISEKWYIPSEAGADELRIYAVNELCVVSPIHVRKVDVEKSGKK